MQLIGFGYLFADAFSLADAIGILGADDDSGVVGYLDMETLEIPAIECQKRSSKFSRSCQYIRVGDCLIGPAVFECSEYIMAQPS